jgi:hypothetical protein
MRGELNSFGTFGQQGNGLHRNGKAVTWIGWPRADVTETIDTQLSRVLWQLQQKSSDFERYIYFSEI